MSDKNKKAPFYRKEELTEEEIVKLSEDALTRMRDAKNKIIINPNFKFWTYLLCSLDFQPLDTGFGTVATDGYHLYYDPLGHIHEWTTQETIGAIIHEIAHCAFGHYWRCGPRDPMVWNMATDYIINYILVHEEKLKLPSNILYNEHYTSELSAEALYSILIKDKEKALEKLKQILDDPELFKKAIENAQSGGHGQGHVSIDGMPVSVGEIRDETWWQDKMKTAGIFAKSRGTLPGYLESLIDDFTEPQLPWKELLRDCITTTIINDYRTLPCNKKYAAYGIYLPSTKKSDLEIVVAMDVSGSVSDEEARQFLTEMRAIAEAFDNYTIHYMQCDTEVKYYKVITPENEHDWPMGIVGRGGTAFEPVFNKVEELQLTPPILVYLTDLGGSFPKFPPEYTTLWISTSPTAPCPWGERINIDVFDHRR